jgi:uncharacterized membrane protein
VSKGRLEAFSDGVIAIIITIMVLELRPPHEASIEAMRPMLPVFLSYAMSYVFLGIYWSNHHHLLQACQRVDGRVLWANLNLLFWLSLVPFVTAWMGETRFGPEPLAAYGVVLLLAAIAYYILTLVLLALHPKDSKLAVAIGSDFKGRISLALYVLAIALSFVSSLAAGLIYAGTAIMWLVPDRRIERTLAQ